MRTITNLLTAWFFSSAAVVCAQDRAWLASEETPMERAVADAMTRTVSLSSDETPLTAVIDQLERIAGLEIEFDWNALHDGGIGADTTVKRLNVKDISLRSALDLVLEPLDLTWRIHIDVLLVTTKIEAENFLDDKIYPVDDLVVDRRGQSVGYESLIELITSTIRADSWDDTGGPGTVDALELNGIHALVISQTREVHEGIASLLAALRRLRGKSPANVKLEHASTAPPPRQRQRVYAHAPAWSAPLTHE
jgi:hypothetical protein